MSSPSTRPDDTRFRRATHTAWRRLDDETLVVDLAGHQIVGLDVLGGRIWEQLDDWCSVAALLGALGDEPTSAARIERFLAELLAQGLVESESSLESTRATVPGTAANTDESPRERSGPCIVWRERMAQVAASCAFLPGQNPLCNAAPFQ